MSDSVGTVAELEIRITSPDAAQTGSTVVGVLNAIEDASTSNATALDSNTQSVERFIGSTEGLTKAQQEFQDRIDAVSQSVANLDRTNAAAVATMEAEVSALVELASNLTLTAAQVKQLGDVETAAAIASADAYNNNRTVVVAHIAALDAEAAAQGRVGAAYAENRGIILQHTQALAMDAQMAGAATGAYENNRTIVLAHMAALEDDAAIMGSVGAAYSESRNMVLLHARALEVDAEMAAASAAGNEAAATASGAHGLQLGRVNMELGTAIGRLTGMNTAVTRFGAMLGGATAGYGPMIAGLVAIGGLLWVWEKFTGQTKEAQKALEAFEKTSEAMTATAGALGALNQGAHAAGANGVDLNGIGAVSEQAKKAGEVVDQLEKKISDVVNGPSYGGSGGAAIAAIKDLGAQVLLGKLNSDQLDASLRNLPDGTFFYSTTKALAENAAQLLIAREAQDRLNATVEQARAIQTYYTQTLGASSVAEGQLLEKISERESVLAALKSGGAVAGKAAEDHNAALADAAKLYDDEAKSGKVAELSTISFQVALKATSGVAHDYAESYVADATRLVEVNRQISDAQKQATSGASDTSRFTALADQIKRVEEEASSFGKDSSIDSKIQGLDDQLSHFVDSLQAQVVAGKLSTTSFEEQAAAVEGLRQNLYSAGAELHQAFDDQTTKRINDEYVATKTLFTSLVDGTGSYHELTAAKAAQNQIDAISKELGHQLSDVAQQQIRDTENLKVSIQNAKMADSIALQAAAIGDEIAAIQSGESTRTTYAADLKYQQQLRDAQLETDPIVKANLIAEITALHDKSVALDLLKKSVTDAAASEKQAAEIAKQFRNENEQLASSLEKDLLSAIERLTSGGLTSFSGFFKEVQSLSTRMFEQLSQATKKYQDELEAALNNDPSSANDDLIAKLQGKVDSTGSQAGVMGKASAGINGLIGGYNMGEQTGNSTTGALGGAAEGAAAGSVAGPWGAVIGGLAGAVGGLFGAADAHKKAAEAEQKAAEQVRVSLLQMNAQAGTGTAVDSNVAQAKAQADALFNSIDAALPGLKNQTEREKEMAQVRADETAIVAKLIAADQQARAAALDSLQARQLVAEGDVRGAAAIQQSIANTKELNDAINQYGQDSDIVAALVKTQAAEAVARQAAQDEADKRTAESLSVRQATASGASSKTIADLQLEITQRQELADAIKSGMTDAGLATLELVQSLEKAAAAAAYVKLITDTNNALAVRAATATGNSALAAQLQQQIDQANELYDAQQKGLDDATIANIKYVQGLEQVALAAQQANAAMEASISQIKEQAGVFGYTSAQTVASEKTAYGFDGLSDAQIQALYTQFQAGATLTPDQQALNKHISDYLTDERAVTNAATSSSSAAGSNSASINATVSDSQKLTETTGQSMADYLASINVHVASLDKKTDGGSPFSIPYAPGGGGGSTTVQVTIQNVNVGTTGVDGVALGKNIASSISAQLGPDLTRERLRLSPVRSIR